MVQLSSYEPATGALVWQGEEGDIDAAAACAFAHWPQWAAQAATFRIETIRRFATAVRARDEALAERIARETGRPLWNARAEVDALLDHVEPLIAAYNERSGQKRLEGALRTHQALRHKPHGVLAVITPWSEPALLPARQIIPALLAGNAVLFKPSERTPGTGLLLTELFHEAGLAPDTLQCIVGGPEAGRILASHDLVAGVLFAGAVQTGIALSRALAVRPDRMLAMEMGGNNPLVLWDTPDMDAATALIVQSALISTGQRCDSARRLIIRDGIADAAIAALCQVVERLIIDEPLANPAPYMGPLIDMESADGLTESFLYLMGQGGRPITHMRQPVAGRPFVTPGLIDVTDMPERPDVELFGPILQIVRVKDFEAAIAEANATRLAKCAALLGGSPEEYGLFWANVRAGSIHWNRPTTLRVPGAPAGGTGLSGNFRPGGIYAADHCAYPVSSTEAPQPRAVLGIGLRTPEVVAER